MNICQNSSFKSAWISLGCGSKQIKPMTWGHHVMRRDELNLSVILEMSLLFLSQVGAHESLLKTSNWKRNWGE